jgi:hypothetical protein
VSLPEIAATGDRLATLAALRDLLAESLIDASPRDRASLARQLTAVLAELEAAPTQEASPVDDLAARRSSRRKAAGSAGS